MAALRGFPSLRILLGCVLLLALLPGLGAVALMLISNAHLQQRAIRASLAVRARSLAAVVDARIEELASEIEFVALSPVVRPNQPDTFRVVAERRLAAHPEWQAFALLDATGRLISLVGAPVAQTAERLARQSDDFEVEADRYRVLIGSSAGDRREIGIAVPLRRDGSAAAVVLGILRRGSLRPALNQFNLGEDAHAVIVSPSGVVLAANDRTTFGTGWPEAHARLLSQPSNMGVVKLRIDGRPGYAVLARSGVAPYYVAYAVPAKVIEQPLELSSRLIGRFTLLLLIPLALVLLLGQFLAGQIRDLAIAAAAVAQEQSPPATQPSKLREVAAVQHALQHAAEVVQERTRTQERLRGAELSLQRLQRLDTVGQLAAGIAHDFGNYLFTIRGNLELIATATVDRPDVQHRLTSAHSLAQQALQLVQQLTALARRTPSGVRQISVADVLGEIADLLRHVAGRGIQLEIDLVPALWNCRFDPLRLQSALVNLVTNARDAMPNGGTICIFGRNLTLSPERAAILGAASPGRYVKLSVSDAGTGMSQDTLRHIFDPFFTTKRDGRGNGIGLSLLYGSVKAVGGCVLVDTAPGQGTTFTILLPERAGAVPPQPPRPEADQSADTTCQ